MVKRILAFIMCAALCTGLVSCGDTETTFVDYTLTTDNYTIEITDWVFVSAQDDRHHINSPLIVFYYDVTSNNDSTKLLTQSAAWYLHFSASQNNSSLIDGYTYFSDSRDTKDEELQAGTTLSGYYAYVLVDTVSPVVLSAKTRSTDKSQEEIIGEITIDLSPLILKSAVSYATKRLEFMPYSRQGIITYLTDLGFTDEEAQYGADNCGADWYEEAAECAESYLEYMSFSRESLIDQLEFEGFTYEEAVYGAEANGL